MGDEPVETGQHPATETVPNEDGVPAEAPAESVAPPPVELRSDLRPPGAVQEFEFVVRCTWCGDCADACPYDAIIRVRSQGNDREVAAMDPTSKSCHMCADVPCSSSCRSGALLPATAADIRFGYVEIDKEQCFTFRGPECGACGVCPLERRALSFHRNRPRIDTELCTGCGMCIEACVVFGSAIRLVPDLRDRRPSAAPAPPTA